MNKVFPEWKTADIIILEIIDRTYGLNISEVDIFNWVFNTSLLKLCESDIMMIPEEDRQKFINIVCNFTRFVFIKMKYDFDRYIGEKYNQQTLTRIENDAKIAINEYEIQNNIDIKEELLKALGYDRTAIHNVKFKIEI